MTSTAYTFQSVTHCNMCQAPVSSAQVLGRRLNCSHGFAPWRKTGIATTVLRCSRCDLVYTNPQPVPNDIQDHYGVPPEDYWTPDYFRFDESYFASEIATTKQLLPFERGMTALDVGAGIGKCMIALQNAGFESHGMEPGAAFYNKAIEEMGIESKRLQHAGIESADFPAASFDFVTFGAVLEHLTDPAASLRCALEWTKPGGLIHAEVPNSRWLIARLVNTYYAAMGNAYTAHLSPMHSPYHLFEFGEESFKHFAAANNVTIEKFVHTVCTLYHVPRALHSAARRLMDATNTGMQLTVWIRKP